MSEASSTEPGSTEPPEPGAVLHAVVTEQPLDTAALRETARSDRDGAVVVFEGVIRDHDHGVSVRSLDYRAHPEAERFLVDAVTPLAAAHGVRVAAAHRIGHLVIGDVALVVAVASPHRAEAFAACAELVDAIKAQVPIWKRQHLVDGTTEWVGLDD